MKMRERMARALARGAFDNMIANEIPLNVEAEEFVDSQWEHWLPRIDLLLDAMEEPDEELCEQVEGALLRAAVDGDKPWRWHVGQIWDRMIKAVRSGA